MSKLFILNGVVSIVSKFSDMHSSPKQHWKVERVVASIMMPSFALGIFVDNMLLDAVIGILLHCFVLLSVSDV